MSSSLTWLDHDNAARERSLRILSLFKEKESRDELGIGAIRDAIADRLFPGTSTIQTRLRYMLLIPWVYQRLEELKVPASTFAGRARQDEIALVQPLLDLREAGVFGRVAGSGLKRLPSSVYWAGLGTWGIRRFPGSQQDYHRAVDDLYARRRRVHPTSDDRRDPDDVHADPRSLSWHPRLPRRPDGYPAKVDLQVTPDEASFFVDRITASCKDSLLAWLVLRARPADVMEPWLHPQLADFPEPMRILLHHGHMFTDVVEGAARVYNLQLAELGDRTDLADEHRNALADWRGTLDLPALRAWSPEAFWQQTDGTTHSITAATRRFVESWRARILAMNGDVADDIAGRDLVRRREVELKKVRSRFNSPGALKQWGGYAGIGRLTYRWANVRTLLADLFAARGEA